MIRIDNNKRPLVNYDENWLFEVQLKASLICEKSLAGGMIMCLNHERLGDIFDWHHKLKKQGRQQILPGEKVTVKCRRLLKSVIVISHQEISETHRPHIDSYICTFFCFLSHPLPNLCYWVFTLSLVFLLSFPISIHFGKCSLLLRLMPIKFL